MARPSRRPRIVGPYFLIAIVLSAGLFIWQKRQNEQKLQNAPPPVVEHQVIDTPDTQSVPPPDLVMGRAKDLGLTDAQQERLWPVAKAYRAEALPLQAQTQAASLRFAVYQQSKAGSKQVQIAEIQAQMAQLSELSSRQVALRQGYWEQVAPILTERQRTQARDLWRQSLTPTKRQEQK